MVLSKKTVCVDVGWPYGDTVISGDSAKRELDLFSFPVPVVPFRVI